MIQDLRLAFRTARKAPLFTLTAVLLLGIGAGGATAVTGFVRGILLAPLPYPSPEELVTITRSNAAQGFTGLELPASDVAELMERATSFTRISGVQYQDVNLSGQERAERVRAAVVLPDLLSLLGIAPSVGRGFDPGRPEGNRGAAILSHRLWVSRYGGAPDALGRTLRHDGETATIIGILAQGVEMPLRQADLILALDPGRLREDESRALRAFARLRPGVALETAREETASIARQLEDERAPPVRGWGLDVVRLKSAIIGEVEKPLLVLQAAVVLALLVACANFATLLLARGTARDREMAIRGALGAGRVRLVRLLLAESLLLALGGSIAGWLVARWTTGLFLAFAPEAIPRTSEVVLDGALLAFGAALALASALLAGAVPAFVLSRPGPARALRASSGSVTSPSGRFGNALTAVQFAAAVSLTVGSALLAQSLYRLVSVEPGFDPDRLLTLQISFPRDRYPQASDRSAVLLRVLERLEAAPGVRSVAVAPWTPMTGSWSRAQMSTQDVGGGREERSRWPMILGVSPGFFRTMAIPFAEGRDFLDQERRDRIIVNRALAEGAWPGTEALGRRIKFGGPDSENPWFEVVGVVENARLVELSMPEEEAMFRPLLPMEHPYSWVCLLVRTAEAPEDMVPSLRTALREVDPEMPLAEIRSMEALFAENTAERRFQLGVIGAFAMLAVVIAALAVHGVAAHWAGSRRREIALRMALGSGPGRVIGLVMRRGMVPVGLGSLAGVVVSLALSRFLAPLLFEVSPSDPAMYLLSIAILAGTGAVATLVPARRAARLDPLLSLKAE